MKNMKNYKYMLRIPLFPLYRYDSLDQIHLEEKEVDFLMQYSLKERKNLYEDLKWAKNNPNYNFESIMEGAPVFGTLKFTNNEVYEYLMLFMEFMEKFPVLLNEDSQEQ